MGNLVDMGGWHVASAVSYADVNKAIAASATKPASFSETASDGSASATADFGSWLLRTGGAGPDIQMQVALTSGTVTVGTTNYKISPCVFPFMLRAKYVPHVPGSSVQDLVPDDTSPVEVNAFDPTQGNPTGNTVGNAVLQSLLQEWMDKNLNQFNAIFASVDLDAQYVNENVSWLQPSYRGYAVVEPATGATLSNSIFGVMCLIDGTEPSTDLAYAISPYSIPKGAKGAFNISSNKFLAHMMLNAVPWMFRGITEEDPNKNFVIDNDGLRIRNQTGLTLNDTKLQNGNVVNPSVDPGEFSISVDGTELVINIGTMGFTYSPGIDVSLTYQGRSNLSLDTKTNLLQLTTTVQSGSGQVQVTEGLQIAEIALSVVAIVMGIIAAGGAAVSKAAAAAVESATTATITIGETMGEEAEQSAQATVTALRGLITGTAQEVTAIGANFSAVARVATIGGFAVGAVPAVAGIITAVADGKYESLPKITDLTSGAVGQTIIWPKQVGNFTLASAQLNGALQFGLVD